MEQRLAILAIVVENPDSVEQLNALLHEYRNVIIGRMGVPYPKRKVSLVSVALDAPMDVVSALSGKVGRLPGVTAKAAVSKVLE
jgi:putative iron-only hydrogenase system regulator